MPLTSFLSSLVKKLDTKTVARAPSIAPATTSLPLCIPDCTRVCATNTAIRNATPLTSAPWSLPDVTVTSGSDQGALVSGVAFLMAVLVAQTRVQSGIHKGKEV